jgi:hypothetical protein
VGEDLLLEQMKAATEDWGKVSPEERFESLVRSGVIDREGRLLRHLPQPPEDGEGAVQRDTADAPTQVSERAQPTVE